MSITVCHYPPGTSKWNKIEHRLFSFISINWRGRALTDMRTIIELIASTTTETGLTVQAVYDPNWYERGTRISDQQMNELHHSPTIGTANGTTRCTPHEALKQRAAGP